MKYQQPSFNVGGASESYDEGYERAFGKSERTKGRWVYRVNQDTGEVVSVPVDADWTDAPRSTGDLGKFEYNNLRATDGTDISSATKHKRYMKEKGYALVHEISDEYRAKRKAERERADNASRRETIGRTMYELKQKRRR